MSARVLSLLGCAVALVAAAWIVPASASVIYEGGMPDQGGTIYSDVENGSSAAMSFKLGSNDTVTGANWWGGCNPSKTCDASPDFSITIWSNSASGTPDTVLDFREVLVANQTATGSLIGGPSGFDEYSYSASFTSFTLQANTQYWIVIQNTSGESEGAWGWETTSTGPSGSQLEWESDSCPSATIGDTSWCDLPQQLAFELIGSPTTANAVPEPSSLLVLCAGLAGLLAFGRRRSSRA